MVSQPATSYEHTEGRYTHRVVESGPDEGRPIILLHELDGFRDIVEQLGRRFTDAGFNVHLPVFFDLSGVPPSAATAVGMLRICVSREFHAFTIRGDSPAAAWLRSLAARIARERQTKVGVVGMCLTGGLALAAVAEGAVGAAVAAQPSTPFANGPRPLGSQDRRTSFGLSIQEEDAVRASGTPILALRFDSDPLSPQERVIGIDSLEAGCVLWVRDGEREVTGHPTLTAFFRRGDDDLKNASDSAIQQVILFLDEHLRNHEEVSG